MSNSGVVLSSSPVSTGTVSPVHRRGSSSVSGDDSSDNRPRLSPTLARSYDPNDTRSRERQQTLDMDMAMHLSKARRDTANISPITTHEEIQPELQENAAQATLSSGEQHEIDMAQGPEETDDLESIRTKRPPSPMDLRDLLPQSHDPSLLVSLNGVRHPVDDPTTSSTFGALPTYQANTSQPVFNFSPMESFAATERLTLGITSPQNVTTKFSLPPPNNRHPTDDLFLPRPIPPVNSPDFASEFPGRSSDAAADSDIPVASSSNSIRQRKLSQSNPHPRSHRKGIGGKLALFENANGGPGRIPFSLGPSGNASTTGAPVAFDSSYLENGSPSLLRPATVPAMQFPSVPGLHTGHDRPYRFSFYSNSLPSTIHARSLSELPADGQSFEDLFAGVSRDRNEPVGVKRPASAGPKGYFPGNVKPTYRSRPGFGGGLGFSTYEGEDPESSTWWLDVLSPTDEEMKMLSTASHLCLCT